MKYIKLFESELDASDLNDKRILDRIVLLYQTDLEELAECDFSESPSGDAPQHYDFYVTSRFGEVGFDYKSFDDSDYNGDGEFTVMILYSRRIGNFVYKAFAKGTGKAYHEDDLDEVIPYALIEVRKNKVN